MEDVRSQHSGENPDVVFCYSVHHISGSANPADLATRGVSSSTLLTSIWLCGPKFLHGTFPFQTDSSVPTLNDAVPEESTVHYNQLLYQITCLMVMIYFINSHLFLNLNV
ncbi:hypothetical protein TNCT_453701 [Trichonephila clavata]|uniref:Uncharacterized protein n=1 Tax=Trichonephila clavata TaxID=2740835 RepID=A0A8X6M393_TRICU|nr:hypothetical protein TNCT_453701 [Trichonephila clavata]